MTFQLPPKSSVGALDPEIAGEGMKVILSDGEQVDMNIAPPKPVFPDWSGIKSIRHYFNRTGYRVYPAWLYHPSEEPRLVKNADEAAALGICYREATVDERGRYGRSHVWDWQDDSQWRPIPYGPAKFDPKKISHAKNFVPTPVNPADSQNALLAALIPQVAAVVARELRGATPTPGGVSDKDWGEFLQFKAWQKAQEAVGEIAADAEGDPEIPGLASNALSAANAEGDDEREHWMKEAERKGLKIDRRWATARIKEEVTKAA